MSALAASSSVGTYVKVYAGTQGGSQVSLTPVDVEPTADGGAIALALADTTRGLGVTWLVKLSSTGAVQWQEEVGCTESNQAPGDYANGVSVQQTADGGYIVAGGTVDCGSGGSCPPLGGQQCALVEKFSSSGALSWARVYGASSDGDALNWIRQTPGGGYVAVGSDLDASGNTAGLVLGLDGAGDVLWQRDVAPQAGTSDQVELDAVEPTADGGDVAVGVDDIETTGLPKPELLVVKLDGSGDVTWQRQYGNLAGATVVGSVQPGSITQTSDGGYAVAGGWTDPSYGGDEGASGALLMKLDSSGDITWQRAYSEPTYDNVGGFANSVFQTSSGGYVLGGESRLNGYSPVPWFAETDPSGNLVWQRTYYQLSQAGRPLGQDFDQTVAAPGGGQLAEGSTEDPADGDLELYLVRTDSSGQAGTCPDDRTPTALSALGPGITGAASSLAVSDAPLPPSVSAPVGTAVTSVRTQSDC